MMANEATRESLGLDEAQLLLFRDALMAIIADNEERCLEIDVDFARKMAHHDLLIEEQVHGERQLVLLNRRLKRTLK